MNLARIDRSQLISSLLSNSEHGVKEIGRHFMWATPIIVGSELKKANMIENGSYGQSTPIIVATELPKLLTTPKNVCFKHRSTHIIVVT